jgi:hypothetical protein
MTEYQTSDLEETESIDEIFGSKKVSSGPAQHDLGVSFHRKEDHKKLMKNKHGVETKWHGGRDGDELSYHGPLRKVKKALITHYGGDHDEAKFHHPHIFGAKKESLNYDEEDNMVEAQGHDPKNAEAQSIASVDKAGEATGTAPARKGDKKNSEPMPKTKAALMAGMVSKMQGMNKQALMALYGEAFEDDQELETVAEQEASYDFDADLNALVESEATLSDEFKGKAGIIFEAAVKSKIAEEVERLEENYKTELQEEVDTFKNEMVEKVDGYLNYVVENWMEENKLAIQSGLRTEIAEGFMNKLKDLFTESYVEVPESKVDLVDDLAEQVEELETKLNESTAKQIQMTEELEQFKRYEVIREHARGLAETEVEKLIKLTQDIDYVSEETFGEKVATIKESYFKKAVASENSADLIEEEAEDEVEVSDAMNQYLAALKKTIK